MPTPDDQVMDDDAIAEIEARANAATEGPWEAVRGREVDDWGVTESKHGPQRRGLFRRNEHQTIAQMVWEYDAPFIAHAREDIPALCRTVKQLRAENVRVVNGQRDLAGSLERIATSIGMSWCCTAETMELESRVARLQSQLKQLQAQIERGALCEECDQWEYNEDGSCRTFMVCGACWNVLRVQIARLRAENEKLKVSRREAENVCWWTRRESGAGYAQSCGKETGFSSGARTCDGCGRRIAYEKQKLEQQL